MNGSSTPELENDRPPRWVGLLLLLLFGILAVGIVWMVVLLGVVPVPG